MKTTQTGVIGAIVGLVLAGLAYLGLPADTFCPAPQQQETNE